MTSINGAPLDPPLDDESVTRNFVLSAAEIDSRIIQGGQALTEIDSLDGKTIVNTMDGGFPNEVVITANTVQSANFRATEFESKVPIKISNSGTLELKSGGGATSVTFPATAGTPGYVLGTNGAGVTSWVSNGDSTRIRDAADTTFIDTDATASTLTGSAGGTPVFAIDSSSADIKVPLDVTGGGVTATGVGDFGGTGTVNDGFKGVKSGLDSGGNARIEINAGKAGVEPSPGSASYLDITHTADNDFDCRVLANATTGVRIQTSGTKDLDLYPRGALAANFQADKVRLTAGVVGALNPASTTFYATYVTNANSTFSVGDGIGTLVGTAVVNAGFLELKNSDGSHCLYSGILNADSGQLGALKIGVRPNYSGTPVNRQVFIFQGKTSTFTKLCIYHETDGNLYVEYRGDSGGTSANNMGAWVPVLGTVYDMELNYDFNTGAHRLFIDGTQFGVTLTDTKTRTNLLRLAIGTANNGSQISNFSADYIAVYNAVQHTANFVAPALPAAANWTPGISFLNAQGVNTGFVSATSAPDMIESTEHSLNMLVRNSSNMAERVCGITPSFFEVIPGKCLACDKFLVDRIQERFVGMGIDHKSFSIFESKFALDNGSFRTTFSSQATIDHELKFPVNAGAVGQVLTTDGTGVLSWSAAGAGDEIKDSGTGFTSLKATDQLNIDLKVNSIPTLNMTSVNSTFQTNVLLGGGGVLDTQGATGLSIGPTNCTSIDIGRVGAGSTTVTVHDDLSVVGDVFADNFGDRANGNIVLALASNVQILNDGDSGLFMGTDTNNNANFSLNRGKTGFTQGTVAGYIDFSYTDNTDNDFRMICDNATQFQFKANNPPGGRTWWFSSGKVKISEEVTIDTDLRCNDVDTTSAQTLLIGKSTASRIEIAKAGTITSVEGILSVSENINALAQYSVNGTQVVGAQQAGVADPTGGATIDAEARTAIISVISALETHGLLATLSLKDQNALLRMKTPKPVLQKPVLTRADDIPADLKETVKSLQKNRKVNFSEGKFPVDMFSGMPENRAKTKPRKQDVKQSFLSKLIYGSSDKKIECGLVANEISAPCLFGAKRVLTFKDIKENKKYMLDKQNITIIESGKYTVNFSGLATKTTFKNMYIIQKFTNKWENAMNFQSDGTEVINMNMDVVITTPTKFRVMMMALGDHVDWSIKDCNLKVLI